MSSLKFIEDRKSYSPSKLNDKVLLDDHRLMHIGWLALKQKGKWGSWTKEEIWNKHRLIVEEMQRRGMKHNIILKDLDNLRFEEVPNLQPNVQGVVEGLKTFVVMPEFISLVGSSAEGREVAKDVDFVIKLKSPNEEIEEKLTNQEVLRRIAPDVHFVYDVKGSHGIHVPLYDLVAVRRYEDILTRPSYSFPLFGAAPRAAVPEVAGGVQLAYLHKDTTKCELLDEDGNRIIDYPHIEQEGSSMAHPEIYILCGYLTSDGKLFAQDIYRWNSTELVESPEKDRQFFLDKFNWTENVLRDRSDLSTHPVEFEEKIQLMKPFLPLKVRAGYGQYEFNNIDELIKFWAAGENLRIGIAIQEKADGFRLVWHKRGSEVKAFTEDKRRDRADMLPAITSDVKKLSPDELILDTEVVMYDEKGKPRARHESMAVIASKTPITSPVGASVHDCLWYNGSKIDAPYSERIALARKAIPQDTKHLRVMSTMIAHTEEQLRNFVRTAAKMPGSEGAMLKVLTSTYPLTGRTPLWAKLKMVKEITLKVIGIRRKRVGGVVTKTFLYRGAFTGKNWKLVPMYSQHIIGPKDMQEESEWEMGLGFKNAKVGEYGYAETYASNIEAKFGDLITVAPIHILKFMGKDNIERYAFMFPRLRNLETAKTKPDTQEQLDKLAELGEGSEKMKLEEFLESLKPEDFPLTVKEV